MECWENLYQTVGTLKCQKYLEGVIFEKTYSDSDLVIWYLSSVSRLLNFVAIVTSLVFVFDMISTYKSKITHVVLND